MYKVRKMKAGDAAGMHDVHTRAVRQVCGQYLEKEVVEAWLSGRTVDGYMRILEAAEESFWVAESDSGSILGFASWRADEQMSVFVDPQSQGIGIGRALFSACEAEANEAGHRITWVRATRNAKSFYEAFGFHGDREGFIEKRGQRIPYIEMQRE